MPPICASTEAHVAGMARSYSGANPTGTRKNPDRCSPYARSQFASSTR